MSTDKPQAPCSECGNPDAKPFVLDRLRMNPYPIEFLVDAVNPDNRDYEHHRYWYEEHTCAVLGQGDWDAVVHEARAAHDAEDE